MRKLRPQPHLIEAAIASTPVDYRELAARAINDYIRLVNVQRGYGDSTDGDDEVPVRELHRPGQDTSELALEKSRRSRQSFADKVYNELKFCKDGAIPEEIATVMNAEIIDVRRAFHVLKKLKRIHFMNGWRKNDKDNYCEVWSTTLIEREYYSGFKNHHSASA